MMIRILLVFVFTMGIGWQPLWCLAADETAPSTQDSAPGSSESQASASPDTKHNEDPAPLAEDGSSKPVVPRNLVPQNREPVRELHDVGTASTPQVYDAIRSNLQRLGTVSGTPSGKILLSVGDMVMVRFEQSAQPKSHDMLAVVRPTHTVRHPQSNRLMGRLVKAVGVIELDQEAGPAWSGRIIQSPDFMSVGDVVVALEPEAVPTDSATSEVGSGYVVAVPDEIVLIGAFQTVFTDLGLNQGVRPGQVFTIVRKGSGGSKGNLSRPIGEAKVVWVQPASSSVLVTKSAEPIEIGDRIEALSGSTPR